jgi:Zn-dependent protease
MISASELLDIAIMTVAVGFIFMGLFTQRTGRRFDWKLLCFACMVIAPALIMHELAHKFVANAAGLQAEFHAAYLWLGLGVMLRLARAPFIFFVPAYVSISCQAQACNTTPSVLSLIAFAGPAMNLLLFFVAQIVIAARGARSRYWLVFWHITRRINLFLFIFNILPIPGFDGFKVLQGLLQAIM